MGTRTLGHLRVYLTATLAMTISSCAADDGGTGTTDMGGDGGGSAGDDGVPHADCPESSNLVGSGVDAVYFEVESVPAGPDWTEATDVDDYLGDAYYQWKDEKVNEPGDGDTGYMTYCFEVETAGTYKLGIRGRRDRDTEFCKDAADDACNDVFVRFNDDPWTKKMIKPPWGEWKWDENWDPQNGSPFPTEVELDEGVHTLEVAGRSHGTKIDAIRIYEKDADPPGP